MKKKLSIMLAVVMTVSMSQTVFANMAAPKTSDIGSTINFEKNQDIAVISEVLEITVTGSTADIVACYEMKNTTDQYVSTQTMFLSPNVENSGVQIMCESEHLQFTQESYALDYDTDITTNDWKYAVLSNEEMQNVNDETVDSITFDIEFDANEQKTIVVSYTYALGGYPDYDFNAKNGVINYYLTPANMWKDFENLTIKLTLAQDMPVITDSNLEFEKTGKYTYEYTSDTLPEENLEIHIDENWFQNIFSTLRSPYFAMTLVVLSPFIVVALLIIAFVAWRVIRNRKIKGYRGNR